MLFLFENQKISNNIYVGGKQIKNPKIFEDKKMIQIQKDERTLIKSRNFLKNHLE